MAIGFRPQQRRGLFGSAMTMPQSSMMQGVNLQQPMPQMESPEQSGGGFFGQGGAGRGIAGAIGDYLLQLNGMRPIYAPQRQYQQHMQNQQKMAEQQRIAGREDKMWEWQNKPQEAPKPDSYERTLQAQGIVPGTAAYAEAMRQRQEALLRDPNSKETMFNIPGFGTFFGTIEQAQQLLSGRGQQSAPAPTLPPDFFD